MKPLITIDWARNDTRAVFPDGSIKHLDHPMDLFKVLNRPHRIVFEASLLSYPSKILGVGDAKLAARQERDAFILAGRAAGHDLECFANRQTQRARSYLLDRPDTYNKTDADDDVAIRHIAETPGATVRAKTWAELAPSLPLRETRAVAANVLKALRTDQKKDDFTDYIVTALGLPSRPVASKRHPIDFGPNGWVWGDASKWSSVMIAAVAVAAAYAKTRKEFEFFMGFSSNGAKSIFRSDLMHHRWRWISGIKDGYNEADYKKKRSIVQHELRAMYRRLRNANVDRLLKEFVS